MNADHFNSIGWPFVAAIWAWEAHSSDCYMLPDWVPLIVVICGCIMGVVKTVEWLQSK